MEKLLLNLLKGCIYLIKIDNDVSLYNDMLEILAIWGCMPELTKDCVDMTNASSTYLSIAIGVVVGVVISWWIYHAQKKTSEKQDEVQKHIKDLEESHERILRSIEEFQKHQERILNQILRLDKKIDSVIENKDT